jgi:hypothetical protein
VLRDEKIAWLYDAAKSMTWNSPPVLHEASLTPIDENELG